MPDPNLPPSDALPVNYVQIGDFELGDGTPARCVLTIKPKSDSKVDKKEADGKSAAVTTWKGAKPVDWEIEMMWIRRDVRQPWLDSIAHETIVEFLYQVSPSGPNPGKPQQFAHRYARIHGTDNVIVENVDGPNDKPGSDEVTAKLKLSSWKKPSATAQGQGDAKTDTDPTKWKGGDPHGPTTVGGFGGDPGNTVTFPGSVPTVKP